MLDCDLFTTGPAPLQFNDQSLLLILLEFGEVGLNHRFVEIISIREVSQFLGMA